jgi:hypothetical protein
MSPFSKTLAVGALASASLPLAVLVLDGTGTATAMALHAIGWTSAYLAWLAGDARRRLAVAAGTLVVGSVAWLVVGSVSALLGVLGLWTAGARSGWLFQRARVRAFGLEAVVLAAALAVAGFLSSGAGLLGAALAVWGWFVVQSFYFLVGGLRLRPTRGRGDSFEAAAARLERLLDGAG